MGNPTGLRAAVRELAILGPWAAGALVQWRPLQSGLARLARRAGERARRRR